MIDATGRSERRPRRLAAAGVGAVDGLLSVAVPVAALAVLALAAWATGGTWDLWTRAGADLWLDGHGVRLAVAGPPAFTVGLAALGPAVVTLAAGARGGRRLARTAAPVTGGIVALAVVAIAGAAVAVAADAPAVRPVLWQAAVLPAAWYGAGQLLGGRALRAVLRDRPVLAAAVRAGGGTALALVAAGALAVAALLAAHLPDVVGAAELLHTGAAGGAALAVGELALVPTLVVWAVAFLVGPGVSLGAGTLVAPAGVHLGALPAVPLLAAVPSTPGAGALAVLAVPVLVAAVSGALARRRGELPAGAAVPVGLGAALVAGGVLGALAAAASGSAGPGRLAVVGPDPLLVAAAVAVPTAVAAGLGFAFGRPVAHALPPEHELPPAWRDLGPA